MEVVAVGLKSRPRRRARRLAAYRRPQRHLAASSDPAGPPTWRVWKARTGRRWWRYPLAVEWALEWFVYRLRGVALFDLLELAGRTTVLVAVVIWFLEADNRAKERHYRAWELINAARGSTGDGGRRDALQDLNRDHVSLRRAPLEQAYLAEIDLEGADLVNADLQGADLENTDLLLASLVGANLQGADLQGANLLLANLMMANLQDARLQDANLLLASLSGANLQGADLQGADLQGVNLQGVNLQVARFLTQEQLNAADGDDRTVLPDGLTRPAHWSKAEGSEGRPAAQPDDSERAPAAEGAPGLDK